MALRYTKDELEKISVRLQCCAVDAAKEALTAEMFLDREKNKCAWNKFKFLQRTSSILKEYIPGGMYTYTEPFTIENEINPFFGDSVYVFKGATIVEDITSDYYGFAFVVFGDPDTGNTYIYVIYKGELHAILNTIAYSAPYMRYIQSVAYDSSNEVLLLGASGSIQEYDLAPLLLPSPAAPTATGYVALPSTSNFYSAFNRINNTTYFTNSIPAPVVKKYYNTGYSFDISVGANPTHVAVNKLNGEVWVVCGTDINVVHPFTDTVIAVLDLFVAFGATQINKIEFSSELNLFIVPWFDGVFTYKVALLNPDGTVYTNDIFQDSNNIYHSIYYQQLQKYFIGGDYTTTVLPDNYGFSTELVRTILNDTKFDKVLVCTDNFTETPFEPIYSSTPFRITVLSAVQEEEPLCLNDSDIEGLLETAQHYCCDCCPNPVVSIANEYDNPFVPEPPVVPGELKKIYYGYTDDAEIAKTNPQSVMLMNSINRYDFQGVYNSYNPTSAYIVFALPVSMGIPTGFLNHVTSGIITMVPTVVLYSGVLYRLYVSTALQPTNLSLEVY